MALQQQPVVVGVDGSPGSDTAVRWAAREAASRRLPLRLVNVYQWPPRGLATAYGGWPELGIGELKGEAEQILDRAAGVARAAQPLVPVDTLAIEGPGVPELLAQATGAALLVVGSRHLQAAGSVLLGSVGAGVAARAECPVVVVRGPAGEPDEGAWVVAGVDGSPGSQDVLAYAFDHASRYQVRLRAVLCWHPHLFGAAHWLRDAYADARIDAEARLSEALDGWREKYPEVDVHGVVIDDHPGAGLVAESHGAHLLVVAAHGRHPVAGTLLGSTGQAVLHHATCPVVIIPRNGATRHGPVDEG